MICALEEKTAQQNALRRVQRALGVFGGWKTTESQRRLKGRLKLGVWLPATK
jgi:hypothetical protein